MLQTTSSGPQSVHGGLSSDRRSDIQGLRAIAVAVVVLFHAGAVLPGGYVGVDIFFVISGYVITGMLSRERLATGSIDFYRFYTRRFQRLVPALALVIALTCGLSVLLLSPFGTQIPAAKTGIAALLLSANRTIALTTGGYFDLPAETNPLLHTWSLSVEEQFYVVFPALLFFGWKVSRRSLRAPTALLAIAIGALSFALALYGLTHEASWLTGFYSSLTRAWEFAAGSLMYALFGRYQLRTWHSLLMGCVGLTGLVASLFLIDSHTPFPGSWTVLPVACTALLLVSGLNQASAITRVLSARPMILIGDWSYSIYLWHWPFIVFANQLWPQSAWARPVAALVSVVPAVAAYYWIEEPIRQTKDLRLWRICKLVTVTMLPAGCLAGFLWLGAANGFWLPQIRDYQAIVLPYHAARMRDCFGDLPLSADLERKCVWNANAPGPRVYLVGDSNSEHLSEAVIGAGEALKSSVMIAGASACPLLDGYFRSVNQSAIWNDNCRAYSIGTLEYLKSVKPGIVVIASIDSYYAPASVGAYALGVDQNSIVSGYREKLGVLASVLARTVKTLESAGHKVVLVQTTPNWIGQDRWDPFRCSMLQILVSNCNYSMPVSRVLERQGEVRNILEQITANSGATLIDPWHVLCRSGRCSTVVDGLVAYRDASHISVAQSTRMAILFGEELRPLAGQIK